VLDDGFYRHEAPAPDSILPFDLGARVNLTHTFLCTAVINIYTRHDAYVTYKCRLDRTAEQICTQVGDRLKHVDGGDMELVEVRSDGGKRRASVHTAHEHTRAQTALCTLHATSASPRTCRPTRVYTCAIPRTCNHWYGPGSPDHAHAHTQVPDHEQLTAMRSVRHTRDAVHTLNDKQLAYNFALFHYDLLTATGVGELAYYVCMRARAHARTS
jgi:hypothetical protein